MSAGFWLGGKVRALPRVFALTAFVTLSGTVDSAACIDFQENPVPAIGQNAKDQKAFDPAKKGPRVLFVGNSITLHGPRPQIGWTNNCGMAASSRDKDYVHILQKKITAVRPDAQCCLLQVSGSFERSFYKKDWSCERLFRWAREFRPDVIVLFFGANVPKEYDAGTMSPTPVRTFGDALELFRTYLDPDGKACVLFSQGFYVRPKLDAEKETVAVKHGDIFVNMEDVRSRKDAHGRYGHPGDLGMVLIAERFWRHIEKHIRTVPEPVCPKVGERMAVCYPVPEGYVSRLWEVMVEGRANGVARARTCDAPFNKHYDFGGEYAFTSFEMRGPVKMLVRPKKLRDLSSVRILPTSAPVNMRKLPDGSLELTVAKPCRFSVEPDNRRNPLLVFANPPEQNMPDVKDPKVKVYGAGVHLGGERGRIELKDGETLYLKPGAFVKCGVLASGKDIRICGRGVIDGTHWKWRAGPTQFVVQFTKCQNATLEGVTILGAWHWSVVPRNCDGVTVRNVKICGGRVQNDDGIDPCNSRDLLIENCFIRTDDDCFAAKGKSAAEGNCENVTVRDCVFWCDRARVVLLGHESQSPYMRNFRFENCDVIHFQKKVFLLEPGEEMRMENIRVRDVRINTDVSGRDYAIVSARPTVNMYMRTKKPGHISDCAFENVSVTGERANCQFLLEGSDEEHKLRNVKLSNVNLYGCPVRSGDPSLHVGAFAEDVAVQ